MTESNMQLKDNPPGEEISEEEEMAVSEADPDTEESVEEAGEDLTVAEFTLLNNQLDRLDDVLDTLERKNDLIQQQLIELLISNKEARQQFQQQLKLNALTDPK